MSLVYQCNRCGTTAEPGSERQEQTLPNGWSWGQVGPRRWSLCATCADDVVVFVVGPPSPDEVDEATS